MKKFILIAALLASTASWAGEYASIDFNNKDKQSSDQVNRVIGLNVGTALDNGFRVEGRLENEMVETPTKHEGLVQIKAQQDLGTFANITPYVGVGTGYKSKADDNFNFYVAEAGARTAFGPVGVQYGYRWRDAYTSGHSYGTHENSLTISYALDKSNTVFVRGAVERGDSDYNTVGLGFKHAF